MPRIIFLLLFVAATALRASAPPDLDRQNVIWTTPSKNPSGSMPIGNGEVGLNLWVEEDGDLLFYISRTDAWSEACRLLKLGRIRVSISPNPFAKGLPFRQELKLREGRIEISAGERDHVVKLKVSVDANAPVIHVMGSCDQPRQIKIALETWRTERRVLTGEELQSSWTMQEAPSPIEVWESADVVTNSTANSLTWFHRNAYSVVPLTLKHQGIEHFSNLVSDPLLNRTFGGRISARGFVRDGSRGLRSDRPLHAFDLQITTHSAVTATSTEWEEQLHQRAKKSRDGNAALQATAKWWDEFWDHSWIFVESGSSPVTQAYVLQRWMTACAGRGNYPIKFNGSIFTVDPEFSGGPKFNADWRKWGDCYWWQNTRLPYFPMIARGDFDELAAVFRLYRNAVPLSKARAKFYYGADGVYFPETMTIFGTYANRDYGWDRKGLQPSDVNCPWWRFAWQQGLELCALMLDYYEHTLDRRFLSNDLLPMAHDVLRYYDTRFATNAEGKLVIAPTQAVETYWHGVTNDTPSVAGLNDVLNRLLALPKDKVPAAERAFWLRMKAAAPPLPTISEANSRRVLPGEKFNPERTNVENPELYALWPFRVLGVGQPDLSVAVETFQRRPEKASIGWQYDGQCAAAAGLAEEAKNILLGKIRNSNPNHRFPAMWGPNYDWLPDQDHGSNIMLTLQAMLLRTVGEKIYLLPAWPADWNARFKLHAPAQTVVEGVVTGGKLVSLKVTPESRRKDVVVGFR